MAGMRTACGAHHASNAAVPHAGLGAGSCHFACPLVLRQRLHANVAACASTVDQDTAASRNSNGAAARRTYDVTRTQDACDSGLPDVDACSVEYLWQDSEDDVIAESAKQVQARQRAERLDSVLSEAWSRGKWLLGLLVLQSMSSVVLDKYQALVREHLVVTLFLTMLVGAGGNAGNQSAIKVIRGLATGQIDDTWASIRGSMGKQLYVGLILGTCLAAGGFARVYLTNGDTTNAVAISLSLLLIVISSVVVGSGLPFVLSRVGVDPANAGTSIQVIMDVSGVAITCVTCDFIFSHLSQSFLG